MMNDEFKDTVWLITIYANSKPRYGIHHSSFLIHHFPPVYRVSSKVSCGESRSNFTAISAVCRARARLLQAQDAPRQPQVRSPVRLVEAGKVRVNKSRTRSARHFRAVAVRRRNPPALMSTHCAGSHAGFSLSVSDYLPHVCPRIAMAGILRRTGRVCAARPAAARPSRNPRHELKFRAMLPLPPNPPLCRANSSPRSCRQSRTAANRCPRRTERARPSAVPAFSRHIRTQ